MRFLSFSVSPRWAKALLLPVVLAALTPAMSAQSLEDDTYSGESPERYASVRVLEGEATVRKGDLEEPLSRGVPITEGDVVESHGRGILQLADGTRVAFASATRFQIATLFTDQDRQVLLRLDYGRLRVAMGRENGAQIRLDLPSGSALLSDAASASFEMERDRTARVKMHAGRMVFFNGRDKASLLAGERLTVYSDQDRLDRIQNFNTYGGDSFDAWCERNLAVRRGPSWEKVPQEIRYYADDLDDNGEWIYVDEYQTWCWRPLRVSAEWRPYWRGRWGAYPGGMTWISDEPWGYVTYHHGRWGWGGGLGWYWIPGVFFSPAWVAWHSSDAYFGWAPMGYHDSPAIWGHGTCWNVVELNFIYSDRIHTRTHHDPGVIRTFNTGSGATGWNNGNRSLAHPWRQGPLVVSQDEFRNPAQLRRVLQDPSAVRNRRQAYEQQSGRTAYRRPLSELRSAPRASGPPPAAVEDRDRLQTPPSVRPKRSLDRPQVYKPVIPQEQPIRAKPETPRSTPSRQLPQTPPRATSSSPAPLPPPPILQKRPLKRP